MISLPGGLPLIRVGALELIIQEETWLEESISRAADRAGHSDWWFSRDVARATLSYLRDRFTGTVIDLDDLYVKVSRTLDTIGFSDIAEELIPEPPPIWISLAEVASVSGPHEMLFFKTLGDRLDAITGNRATILNLTGLQPTVERFTSAEKSGEPQSLNDSEIVEFVRERTATLARSGSLTIVIC